MPEAPTYSLYRIAAQLAGAEATETHDVDAALTFACRPNNPTGAFDALPDARPLVVDEAYFEYAGETALAEIESGDVVVVRTFSKAFALAGARIGYALAARDVADELNARQAPAPVSTISAALALAALASPPDVEPVLEERERLAAALRALGLAPLPSRANFVYVPVEDGRALGAALLRQGIVVRSYADAIRIGVLDAEDDDALLEALARVLDRPSPVAAAGGRRVRVLRATAETRLAVRLSLDGASRVRVSSGAGLYDHFLEQLAFHAGFDLVLEGAGDLETGDHHTAEDAALAFGQALDAALGDRRGIARYGDAVVPMDDALARAAVDLGGRAHAELELEHDPGSPRTCSRASPRPRVPRSTSPRRDAIRITSPRRPSRRSAARCVSPSGTRATVFPRRRGFCERRDLRVRRGERPLRRARVRAAGRRANRRRRSAPISRCSRESEPRARR